MVLRKNRGDTVEDCIDFCTSIPDCTIYSYCNGDCLAYSSCKNWPNTIPEDGCTSSELGCPSVICNEPGFCADPAALVFDVTYDKCLVDCQADPQCNWISYNTEARDCFKTQTCNNNPAGCSECVRSEKDCPSKIYIHFFKLKI